MRSAPASRYAAWTSRMTSGRVRVRYSLQPSYRAPPKSSAGLRAEDFGGARYEGCNEYLTLTRPDVIREVHAAYLEAGADLISTNTFGCAPYVLGEYGLAERA